MAVGGGKQDFTSFEGALDRSVTEALEQCLLDIKSRALVAHMIYVAIGERHPDRFAFRIVKYVAGMGRIEAGTLLKTHLDYGGASKAALGSLLK